MTLHTVERFQARPIREGELVYVCVVRAANILRDIREHITNTLGGKMRRYESLVDETLTEALAALESKAQGLGYDGVVAVRISHPRVAEGGVEVVVYGTGFNYLEPSGTGGAE